MSLDLERAFASPEAEERIAACRALPEDPMGALFLERCAARLGDRDERVIDAASDAIVAMHRRGESVARIVRDVVRGKDAAARLPAALLLARLDVPGPELLPALVVGLSHANPKRRWAAARSLVDVGRLHPEGTTLVLGLVRAGEDPLLRRMAMHCLRELAPDSEEAAAALVAVSRENDPGLARAALLAMAGLYAPSALVMGRLLEAAGDTDEATRRLATRALREIMNPAPPGAPDLVQLALDTADGPQRSGS